MILGVCNHHVGLLKVSLFCGGVLALAQVPAIFPDHLFLILKSFRIHSEYDFFSIEHMTNG